MKSEFMLAFNQICAERGLPREVVLDALKTALVSAYRRNVGASAAQNVIAEIDEKSGKATIYVEKKVVAEVQDGRDEISLEEARRIDPEAEIGSTVMVESTPRDFGRIAAQTAKQVILQRIREAEREALFEDFSEREGELINGTVQSITPTHVSLNLGRTEAILPRSQQVPGERYTIHQRVRAYVLEVRRTSRGPQIIVSRSHKNMLRRLLELEVPEIYNGTVEIKAIAREAGARSKVAVAANQPGVDPVGSCVGMRGIRIQSIVNELGGEKIDVIEWHPETAVFIANALSPARVLTVFLEEGRTASVIVPDDQLSLAIGREGQNARLAAKLTGWRIDIKSVTEVLAEALALLERTDPREVLGDAADYLPTAQAILARHQEAKVPYAPEELRLLREIIEAVHEYRTRLQEAGKELPPVEEKEEEVEPAEAEAREAERKREAAREEALARIPEIAYQLPLSVLELPTRVQSHLEKAGIENVGQIYERLVEGDEGLLRINGIGAKGLAEIKDRLEVLGAMPTEERAAAEAEAASEPE